MNHVVLVVVESPPGAVCRATLEIVGGALTRASSRVVTVLAPSTFTVAGASVIALDCAPPFAAEPSRLPVRLSASSAAPLTLRFDVTRRAMLAPPPALPQTPPVHPASPLFVIAALGAVIVLFALCIALWVHARRTAPAAERGCAVDAESTVAARAVQRSPARFVATAIVAPSSPEVAAIAAAPPDFPFDFAFTDNPELMSMAKELHFQLGSLETDASSALIGVQS